MLDCPKLAEMNFQLAPAFVAAAELPDFLYSLQKFAAFCSKALLSEALESTVLDSAIKFSHCSADADAQNTSAVRARARINASAFGLTSTQIALPYDDVPGEQLWEGVNSGKSRL
jgi:hypothetical protein